MYIEKAKRGERNIKEKNSELIGGHHHLKCVKRTPLQNEEELNFRIRYDVYLLSPIRIGIST